MLSRKEIQLAVTFGVFKQESPAGGMELEGAVGWLLIAGQ